MATKKKATGTKKRTVTATSGKVKDLKARKEVRGGIKYVQPPDPD